MSDIEDLCQIIHRGIGLNFEDLAEEIIAAGFHRDRTVTTAEELKALAPGAVILDRLGDSALIGSGPRWEDGVWSAMGFEPLEHILLPAIVLWEPGDGDE